MRRFITSLVAVAAAAAVVVGGGFTGGPGSDCPEPTRHGHHQKCPPVQAPHGNTAWG